MASFAKIDPRAFLESEKQATARADLGKKPQDANRPKTLAALATLVTPPPQNENRNVGYPDTTADHHHHGENHKPRPTPAKVAKLAKVEPSVASVDESAWGDAEEERAAIVEYDGGAPRTWAEALARLDPAHPPCDVPSKLWLRFIDDCGRFIDGGWAQRVVSLGWGPLDLFGCDRERPWARIEHQGLLWLLDGNKIVELCRDKAIIETATGARQTYRRKPAEVGRVVLAWELAP